MPWLIVRFPCGSRSMTSTRKPCSLKATARFSVVVVFATPPFWLANTITLCNDFSSVALYARTFGRGSRRMSPMCKRLSSLAALFLHQRLARLAVVVIQILEPGDQPEAAEVDLVRTRVVADVIRVARAVGEKGHATLAR